MRTFIRNLRLRARIGVGELERRDRQDLVINIEFESDVSDGPMLDRIEYAVDYRAITKNVIFLVEQSEDHLVETLADRIASVCMKHEGLLSVLVRVEKPGALRFADGVGVEIERRRSG